MPTRLRTENNYLVMEDTGNGDAEILRYSSVDITYTPDEENETVYFSRVNGSDLPKLSKSRIFSRTEILNGDRSDDTFDTMDELHAFLTGVTGG